MMKRFVSQSVNQLRYNSRPIQRNFWSQHQNTNSPKHDRTLSEGGTLSQKMGGVFAFGVAFLSYIYMKDQFDQTASPVKKEAPVEKAAPVEEKKLQLKKDNEMKYILICGPSGVGKGTVLKELFKKYPELTGFSVSYTNRGPRVGEKDGVDYNFTTEEKFVEEIEKGNFLEHVHFANKRYGTNKNYMEKLVDQGKVCV